MQIEKDTMNNYIFVVQYKHPSHISGKQTKHRVHFVLVSSHGASPRV